MQKYFLIAMISTLLSLFSTPSVHAELTEISNIDLEVTAEGMDLKVLADQQLKVKDLSAGGPEVLLDFVGPVVTYGQRRITVGREGVRYAEFVGEELFAGAFSVDYLRIVLEGDYPYVVRPVPEGLQVSIRSPLSAGSVDPTSLNPSLRPQNANVRTEPGGIVRIEAPESALMNLDSEASPEIPELPEPELQIEAQDVDAWSADVRIEPESLLPERAEAPETAAVEIPKRPELPQVPSVPGPELPRVPEVSGVPVLPQVRSPGAAYSPVRAQPPSVPGLGSPTQHGGPSLPAVPGPVSGPLTDRLGKY
ncbi:MAG: hypothetical protein JW937_08605 [Candidatus Omnitrophica bacterium]|nr:hypothetical protein [Candidatus Omnitrophota bacterium]